MAQKLATHAERERTTRLRRTDRSSPLGDGRLAGHPRIAAFYLDRTCARVGLELIGNGHVGFELFLGLRLAGAAFGSGHGAAFREVVLAGAMGFAQSGVVALGRRRVRHRATRQLGLILGRTKWQVALSLCKTIA